MPTVGRYCKAYPIQRLREFEGWRENAANARVNAEDTTPRLLTADSFLYIHESYIVTDGIYIDQNVIFDAVDEDWKRFCSQSLGFQPPGEEKRGAAAEAGPDRSETAAAELGDGDGDDSNSASDSANGSDSGSETSG